MRKVRQTPVLANMRTNTIVSLLESENDMRLSLSMKVGLVSLFSCLALLLGLLSSTGVASAHTATTLHSTHISAMAVADPKRPTNGKHKGVADPSNDSPTTDCPAGMVSMTMFNMGESPSSGCVDPSDVNLNGNH